MDNDIFGITHLPEDIKEELQDRIDIIIHKLKFFPDKPKVAFIQHTEPIALANERISHFIEIAGGTVLKSGSSWEELKEENPEIIVVALTGRDITSAMSQMQHFLTLPRWSEIAAVKNNRVYIADSSNYFEQQGEKAVEALEALAEIITPKYFNFGLEGKVWLKFGV